MEKTGRINPFPLARQDLSDKFQISHKLVGRQKEIDILAAAYNRVSRGAKEMMLIAGPPGVGKTALVLEAGKGFAHHQGLFLQGQFDAADRNVPYAAIVAAFHDLVRQLLTESRSADTLARAYPGGIGGQRAGPAGSNSGCGRHCRNPATGDGAGTRRRSKTHQTGSVELYPHILPAGASAGFVS